MPPSCRLKPRKRAANSPTLVANTSASSIARTGAIPEARRILHELHRWLAEHQFYFDYAGSAHSIKEDSSIIQYYQIAICRTADVDPRDSGFFYFIKGVIADELMAVEGKAARQERFIEATINSGQTATQIDEAASYRVLNISILRNRFLRSLSFFQ